MFYNLINSLKTYATKLIEYIPQNIIYYMVNQYYTIKSYFEINMYEINQYEYITSNIKCSNKYIIDTFDFFTSQLVKFNSGKWDIPNLKENDSSYADIHYNYNNKYYVMAIPLYNPPKISFPPYTNNFILNNKSKKILHASLKDGSNVTKLIRSAAGPLNNFYQDIGLNIKLKYITDQKTELLTIKTMDLKEYKFFSDDILKLN